MTDAKTAEEAQDAVPGPPVEKTFDLSKTADMYSLAKEEESSVISAQVGAHIAKIIDKHGLSQ